MGRGIFRPKNTHKLSSCYIFGAFAIGFIWLYLGHGRKKANFMIMAGLDCCWFCTLWMDDTGIFGSAVQDRWIKACTERTERSRRRWHLDYFYQQCTWDILIIPETADVFAWDMGGLGTGWFALLVFSLYTSSLGLSSLFMIDLWYLDELFDVSDWEEFKPCSEVETGITGNVVLCIKQKSMLSLNCFFSST
jgi:hypothetical protein